MFATGIDTKQKLMFNQNEGHPIFYYRFSFDHLYSAHKADGHHIEGKYKYYQKLDYFK